MENKPTALLPACNLFSNKNVSVCKILGYRHKKIASAQKLQHSVQNQGGRPNQLHDIFLSFFKVARHVTYTLRSLSKPQLLASVDVVIVLGPLSGIFS